MSWPAPHWLLLALGVGVGLAGAAMNTLGVVHERQVAEQTLAQLRTEGVGLLDQVRRFESRWHTRMRQDPPEPLRPPPPEPSLSAQAFRDLLAQGLALNGLRTQATLTEPTQGGITLSVQAGLEPVLALVVQVHEASHSVHLAHWSVQCADADCQGPLAWQLGWQRTPPADAPAQGALAVSTDAQAQSEAAFMATPPTSPEAGTLHNPFAAQAWWQREVDQAPMAKGASRKQWQKDVQAGLQVQHDHNGPWQWLGWMGRREGKRAWVQAGADTLTVQVGQAIAKAPLVVEAMDAQGLRLRSWHLNAQGRWQASHESVEWLQAE